MAGTGVAVPAAGDVPLALVVSSEWAGIDEVSIPLLRQLYMGRRTRLAGQRVRCVHLAAGSPARGAFTRAVIGSSERAMERYWLRQALSGGPPPPRELEPAEAAAWVARQPGAMVYLEWRGDEPPAGLRVLPLRVDGRRLRPGDPDYPLRVPEPPAS